MSRFLLPMVRAFASFMRATSITSEKIKMAVRRTGVFVGLGVGLCGLELAISAPFLAQGKKESQRLEAGYEKPVGFIDPDSLLRKREST